MRGQVPGASCRERRGLFPECGTEILSIVGDGPTRGRCGLPGWLGLPPDSPPEAKAPGAPNRMKRIKL